METHLIHSLEQLKSARMRVDRATSDAARDEALREYDQAIRDFRRIAERATPIEDLLDTSTVKTAAQPSLCTRCVPSTPDPDCPIRQYCPDRVQTEPGLSQVETVEAF